MNKPTLRKNEIAEQYLTFLDRHIDDVIKGNEQEFFSIKHIASTLAVSHTHFTDTIKKVLGKHPCFFYDEKIIEKAKEMLGEKDMQPSVVAKKLTYDPSNFSKFFKKWTGETPGMYKLHFQQV
ncbi:helix-turn-helix domain-containing protein [Epilithonimonas zeae]|uniref:helix-turn-helix domain-containing protein n=1 Tax=Epilithonimonas zeae TaxID=1416779 RepID=UPI00200F581B|nr:AraC family transcriptional regulator [Epilithonimonas zeae]UQB67574.1 helix-turn-helix transcriptional regulator [Epilithonimonas zeae]